ncbi:MAG TPA: DNA replication/repair protein RecF [Firmicutes bacterium]|nr:DNA replication/repair protein RecF [Bacillota bacterium]
MTVSVCGFALREKKVHLEKIKICNFRNYSPSEVELSPRLNILCGKNGQGKTNFLEAIAFLTLGRSFRTRRDEDLIKAGEKEFYLKGKFRSSEEDLILEVGNDLSRVVVKVNGLPYKSKRELFGRVRTVIFTPDDLQIIKGGPEKRREFLDLYLAQAYPDYRQIYLRFYRALYQRNALLKKLREGRRDLNELEVWTNRMVEEGSRVVLYRRQTMEEIGASLNHYHQLMSNEQETLHCLYKGSGSLPDTLDLTAIQEGFWRSLLRRSDDERRRGYTLVGPHRDDLQIQMNQRWELRVYGSQGQQRTAALALKLAMVDLIEKTQGKAPLLLLDDVFSEFDSDRKQELLRLLTVGTQTVISTTELKTTAALAGPLKLFSVASGVISAE